MEKKIKIYVGCALTHADDKFIEDIRSFKNMLRERYEVLDFLWDKIQDPRNAQNIEQEVYRFDVEECVASCDLLVAILDIPSLGLGYEIATAVEKHGKPVLAMTREGLQITRLIRGVTHPNFSFKYYKDFKDASFLVDEKVKSMY